MNIHYLDRYNKFISSCRNSNTGKEHLHHILPTSMGGTDEKTNLIGLTIREHFIAHWMLANAFNNAQCWAAFRIMCLRFKDCSRVTSKMYAISEMMRIEKCSGLLDGQVWTNEEGWVTTEYYRSNKDKFIHMSKGKITVINLLTGKNERILLSDFDPNSYKNIKTGKSNVFDTKEKVWKEIDKKDFDGVRYVGYKKGLVTCVELASGNTINISCEEFALYKNIKYKHHTAGQTFICPHCGKSGGNSMKRWHFDNCRNKEK